jgi:hypothetical protein
MLFGLLNAGEIVARACSVSQLREYSFASTQYMVGRVELVTLYQERFRLSFGVRKVLRWSCVPIALVLQRVSFKGALDLWTCVCVGCIALRTSWGRV